MKGLPSSATALLGPNHYYSNHNHKNGCGDHYSISYYIVSSSNSCYGGYYTIKTTNRHLNALEGFFPPEPVLKQFS